MKMLAQHNIYCPGCGEWIITTIWDCLLGRAVCKECGTLNKSVRIESEDQNTRILVPADTLTKSLLSILFFAALGVVVLLIILAVNSKWSDIALFLGVLFFLTMVFYRIQIEGGFGALSLNDRYLYSKEILLHGTTITIRMLFPDGDKAIDIDCSSGYKPCVFLKGKLLPSIQISTSYKRISFGTGSEPEVRDQLVKLLQVILETIGDDISKVPKSVAELAQELENKGSVSVEDKDQASPKRRLEIVESRDVLILKTSALWDLKKWLIFWMNL